MVRLYSNSTISNHLLAGLGNQPPYSAPPASGCSTSTLSRTDLSTCEDSWSCCSADGTASSAGLTGPRIGPLWFSSAVGVIRVNLNGLVEVVDCTFILAQYDVCTTTCCIGLGVIRVKLNGLSVFISGQLVLPVVEINVAFYGVGRSIGRRGWPWSCS